MVSAEALIVVADPDKLIAVIVPVIVPVPDPVSLIVTLLPLAVIVVLVPASVMPVTEDDKTLDDCD